MSKLGRPKGRTRKPKGNCAKMYYEGIKIYCTTTNTPCEKICKDFKDDFALTRSVKRSGMPAATGHEDKESSPRYYYPPQCKRNNDNLGLIFPSLYF